MVFSPYENYSIVGQNFKTSSKNIFNINTVKNILMDIVITIQEISKTQ